MQAPPAASQPHSHTSPAHLPLQEPRPGQEATLQALTPTPQQLLRKAPRPAEGWALPLPSGQALRADFR